MVNVSRVSIANNLDNKKSAVSVREAKFCIQHHIPAACLLGEFKRILSHVFFFLVSLIWHKYLLDTLGVALSVTVTTRITTTYILVEDPYEPSFATVTDGATHGRTKYI